MSETRDTLEDALDRLTPAIVEPVPAPPTAFLEAVGRRRSQRRVRLTSIVVAAVLLVGTGVIVLTRLPPPVSTEPNRVFAESTPVTTGWYQERVTLNAPVPLTNGHGAPAPVVHASDWRSETRLAALIGSS